MRVRYVLAAVVAVAAPANAVHAGGGGERDHGAVVGVQVSLPGYSEPWRTAGSLCSGHEPYDEFRYYSALITKSDELGVAFTGFGIVTVAAVDGHALSPASYIFEQPTEFSATVVTHELYTTYCYDPVAKRIEPGTPSQHWVPLVSQDTVVPALLAHLEDYLDPPVVEFPSRDPSYGWLYVKAPMDVRIVEPEGVSLTATVTNITGSVTATVSAQPSSVTFVSGDADTAPVQCSVEQATAPFVLAAAGACSVTYYNSSAIAPETEFWTQTVLTYEVTTTSDQFPGGPVHTGHWEPIRVAEVQGVVVSS